MKKNPWDKLLDTTPFMEAFEDRIGGALLAAVRTLQEAGRQLETPVYLVGGSVRDLLLGRAVKDLDLAVEGDALVLARRLAAELGGRLVQHHRFGTASVHLGGERVDLATARREHYARPGTLPLVTTAARGAAPVTIEEDLARRDFSINAMAAPLAAGLGSLVDPFNGWQDLEHGLVRILHPQSFVDDPTRILRAVRYEQRLGLEIERQTLEHLERVVASGGIGWLSGDRLRRELELIFQELKPEPALMRARDLGVLAAIHPALSTNTARDGFQALARRRDSCGGCYGAPAWLSAMTYGMSRAEGEAVGERLNLPGAWRKALGDSVYLGEISCQLEAPELSNSRLVQLLDGCAAESVAVAAAISGSPTVSRRLTEYLDNLRVLGVDLDGSDIQSLGVSPGPELGEMLRQLRNAKLDGAVASREEQLEMARDLLSARALGSGADHAAEAAGQGASHD